MICIDINMLGFTFIIIGVKVVGFLKNNFSLLICSFESSFLFLKRKLSYIQITHLLLMI